MKPVFADTSFYLALLSDRDQHHEQAAQLSARLRRPAVLTEFVLLEIANAMSAARSRNSFIELWTLLRADSTVGVVPVSSDLLQAGYELYVCRQDKDWSLTDCISFVVMQRRGLTDALTADRHFEQAGFSILLS